MNPDILWQVFAIGKISKWDRLLFLNIAIYDNPGFAIWANVLAKYERPLGHVITNLGNTELYYWLRGRELTSTRITALFQHKREDVLRKVLHKNYPFTIEYIMNLCAEYGNLDLLIWLDSLYIKENSRLSPYYVIVRDAAKNGHIHILEWFATNAARFDCLMYHFDGLFNVAASNGQLPMLKWFITYFRLKYGDLYIVYDTILGAVRGGHFITFKWLVDNFNLRKFDVICGAKEVLYAVANDNRLHILKYIHEKFGLTKEEIIDNNGQLIKYVLENSQFQVFRWLIEEFNIDKNYIVMRMRMRWPMNVGIKLLSQYEINMIHGT